MTEPSSYLDNVFINCPFDETYQPLFRAITFTIHDCGFTARCALEEDSTGDVRIQKIIKLIDECRYGIHDISKADLDQRSQLARFNMPLELGIFIGAHHFAPPKSYNRNKRYVVMDVEQYRYQRFISDLSGQDIKAHNLEIDQVIRHVRDFLSTSSRRRLPGAAFFADRYESFENDLSAICQASRLDEERLTFLDYVACVIGWIEENKNG
ncbi:hypothetical protein [Larkinella punicea]|uniref:Uncharacterized protein n=1 Tax=Larkinella punicea TaxID=2315727 RepID=A0A368JZ25_9BACT|nr:hypothetical protein [Larkinella punicea]RCR71461.1 hypothetical protein DUE52_00550 [Larkinella punicea]